MAMLFARSSFIRRGLNVESGTVDSPYQGHLMLPVTNNTHDQIIRIYPGERICQLVFLKLGSDLTEEEAQIHGVARAKYLASTPYGLEARSDSEEELKDIRAGSIKKWKDNYKI